MDGGRVWLSAKEASQRLDVKISTLYSYTSRGQLESVPGPSGRGRLYAAADVERLRARHDARAGHGAVAAAALRWGEPALTTGISDLRADGPYYRGVSARSLLERADSFECVAELLWTRTLPAHVEWPATRARLRMPKTSEVISIEHLGLGIGELLLRDGLRYGANDAEELRRARTLISAMSLLGAAKDAVRTASSARVAERLLSGLGGRPTAQAVHAIDRALILCADHELNASTFAARVAASAGADLYACLAAGLYTLSGVRHGGVTRRVEALLDELMRGKRALDLVRERLARGEMIDGFGHPVYRDGDPRGEALYTLAEQQPRPTPTLRAMIALREAMARCGQPPVNLDAGLVALASALRLPHGSPRLIFATGRMAGWVAHILEQRRQGYLLRPRARYVPDEAD